MAGLAGTLASWPGWTDLEGPSHAGHFMLHIAIYITYRQKNSTLMICL